MRRDCATWMVSSGSGWFTGSTAPSRRNWGGRLTWIRLHTGCSPRARHAARIPLGCRRCSCWRCGEMCSLSRGWTSWMELRCWTSSRTSRRSMRSRRSESAGALKPGPRALWPMDALKLAEAGIWTHKLYSRMSEKMFKLVLLCGLAVGAGCKTESQQAAGAGKQAGQDHNMPGIDCPLRKAGVDPSSLRPFAEVEKYIAFLDRPDRAAWQKPDEVVTALALQGNETVCDLGAGSGYFSFKLARAVPRGKGVVTDLEPEMIRHIHHKAMVEGVTNLTPVIIKADDPQVPGDADYVFVCDVLHHVQDRAGWLKKAVSEMKPGARFVLIEFKEGKLPEGPPEAVKIPRKQLIELVSQAGLALEAEKADLLPYQLFLVFRKGA